MSQDRRRKNVPSNHVRFQVPTQLAAAVSAELYGNTDYINTLAMGDPVCLVKFGQTDHDGFNWRSARPPDQYPSIQETIPPSPLVSSNALKDTGTVLQRQRKQQKPRKKKGTIICQFQGDKCPFMITKEYGVFKNYAELKEDALRHLNPFQCDICGKRFGKRYGKGRHKEKKKVKCVPAGNDKRVVWVGRKLEEAILDLEKAKGYLKVIAAINKCKELCSECVPHIVHLILELQTSPDSLYQDLDGEPRILIQRSPQETGIQNSLPTASGFTQDLLANNTAECLWVNQELGSETYDSVVTSSVRPREGIYGDEPSDEMEPSQIFQGLHGVNSMFMDDYSITNQDLQVHAPAMNLIYFFPIDNSL
ncbi:hypothetical protein EV426DRAFT_19542 [Tirmania nivea]|nr:hypothetical protein EV426DRAFT_19542 [Tirmania nivea]